MRYFFLLVYTLLLFNSCSNDRDNLDTPNTIDPPIGSNQAPSKANITIDSIAYNKAIISWSKSIDPEGDPVTYDLIINNDTIFTNRTNTNFKIVNLKEQSTYIGKIISKDSHKNSTETSLNFKTPKYYLKFKKIFQYPQNQGGNGGGALEIINLSDGSYLTGGYGAYDGSGNKLFLQKTDYKGNEIWNKLYPKIEFDTDFSGYKIIETDNKEIIIAAGYFITKLDLNGNIIWSKKVSLFDNGAGNSKITSLAVDKNGDIFIIGNLASFDPNKIEDGVLVKMNKLGEMLWNKHFSSSIQTSFSSIIIDGESLLIMGLHESSGLTNIPGDSSKFVWNFYFLKTDKNGNKILDKSYPKYNSVVQFKIGIFKRKNGNYIFHGTNADYMDNTIMYEINDKGDVIWDKFYRIGYIKSLKETNDNNLIAVGTRDGSFNTRMYFSLFNSIGEQKWIKDTYEIGQHFMGESVIPEPDGGYRFICSHYKNFGFNPSDSGQFIIYKTDPTGEYEEYTKY